MPEGACFPREQWCRELEEIYGMERKLTPREYFNTGVLVFSRQNYPLIEDLKDHIIFGHPQFEQGFLNVRRVVREIPFFPSPPRFELYTRLAFPRRLAVRIFHSFRRHGKAQVQLRGTLGGQDRRTGHVFEAHVHVG
jgi:hypothetical protein